MFATSCLNRRWMMVLMGLVLSLPVFAQELFQEKQKYMKGIEEIKLASFNVSFMTREGKSASTQSRDNFLGASSKLVVNTVGLQNEELQKVVDEAYQDFITKAEAAGFTVSYFDTQKMGPDWLEVKYKDNYSKDLSHYQPYGWMNDVTVAPTGMKLLPYETSFHAGHAAKHQKATPITINYLIGSGYLQTNAKTRKDEFFGKIYNKTSVKFLPGVSVFWYSGAEIWKKKNKKGQIKINEHIYYEGPAGELKEVSSSEFGGRSSAEIDLVIDPAIYYPQALDVLKQANTKIINAMKKAS